MANILIFTSTVPDPDHFNGTTLRVFFLSREFAQRHTCFLVAFGENEDHAVHELQKFHIFKDIAVIPPPTGRRLFTRHLHLYTGDQTRIALPQVYERVVNSLTSLKDQWNIDLLFTYIGRLGEYIKPVTGVPKVMDIVDSSTMALQRKIMYEKHNLGFLGRLKSAISLKRKKYLERRLTSAFDLTTTVSPVDRDYLRKLNFEGQKRIVDIPNGVNPSIFHIDINNCDEISGSIAFWGALDFSPNLTAIHYFYDEIFRPFLAEREITWYIIGKNPSKKMQKFARKHKNIKLTGYVDDLYGLIARIPIVINPMQIGGGLKNKILEAFALKRLVVSNSLGMEAMNSAKPGIHYVHAATPAQFADSIMKYSMLTKERISIGEAAKTLITAEYTWDKVGAKYLDLIDEVLNGTIKRKV